MERAFDPAAEFLLSMPWHNLFEPRGPGGILFRCKGCDKIVPIHERERHFNKHKGVRARMETMRKKRIERERLERLAHARAIRTARRAS